MRIGFFGGTFDPPHTGHLRVARAAVGRFALDRLLMAPAASQPLKPNGAVASYADRLEMVRLLTAHDPRLEASDADAPRADGKPNYTMDTLERLRSETLGDEIFMVVGIDAFSDIESWHRHKELLQLVDWIVVSRPGCELTETVDRLVTVDRREHVHLLEGVHETVSSSELRQRLHEGDSCETMIPPEVLAYIREQSLYR